VVYFEIKKQMKQSTLGKMVDKTWKRIEVILRKKGFNTILLDSERALRNFIEETIPDNSIVGLGNSLTTSALRIRDILIEKGAKIYYSWNGTCYNRSLDTFEEHPKPDFFLTTADSITPEGRLINHEFRAGDAEENSLPKNIIAFSDFKNVGGTKRQVSTEDEFIIDQKPKSSEITVAILPFSNAS